MFPEPPSEIELVQSREIQKALSPADKLRGQIRKEIEDGQLSRTPRAFSGECIPVEELALIAGELVSAGWRAEVFDMEEKNLLIRFLLSYSRLPKHYGIRVSR